MLTTRSHDHFSITQVFKLMTTPQTPLSNVVWHTIKINSEIDEDNDLQTERMHVNASHYTVVSKSINETVLKFKGAYFISDGGYHRWPCLVNPFKHQPEGTDLEIWSQNIESVRKDIECVFGILKKRFLFLKHPIRIHSPHCIQRAFVTCCVLHNILIDYDGYDTWDEDNVEDSLDYNCLEESAELAATQSENYGGLAGVRAANREMFGLGGDGEEDPDVNPDDCEAYHARRFNLVKHMHRLLEQRQVRMG